MPLFLLAAAADVAARPDPYAHLTVKDAGRAGEEEEEGGDSAEERTEIVPENFHWRRSWRKKEGRSIGEGARRGRKYYRLLPRSQEEQ